MGTTDGFWGSYAVGVLNDVEVGDEVAAYVRAIDATLAPFDGRSLVHGGAAEQVEGEPLGSEVVIAFPTPDGAAAWYRSPGYRRILGLRADHSRSQVVLLEGCDATHRGEDVLPELQCRA